jgi:hypothetical protein
LDLKNKVESRAFVLKSHEEALHEQAREIKKLNHQLSELEKILIKLKMKGMYAFCVCMYVVG